MVVGDVREDAAGELQSADAFLHDGVRRALHEAEFTSGVGHLAHHGIQPDRIGGRMRGLDLTAVDAVDHRRDQSGAVAQGPHQVVEQRHGRGFAVGTGDADQLQFTAREVVESRGQIGHRAGRIAHHHPGHPLGRSLGHTLADDRCGTLFDRHRDIVVAVAARTPHGKEAVAGLHAPRIVGQPRDRGLGISMHRLNGQMPNHFRNSLHLSISTLWLPSGPARCGSRRESFAGQRPPGPRNGPSGRGFRAGTGHPSVPCRARRASLRACRGSS